MNTIKQPLSLSIISWIFMVLGGVGFLGVLVTFNNASRGLQAAPTVTGMALVVFCVRFIVALVAGFALWRGVNWGRWLIALWVVDNLIRVLWKAPDKALPPALVCGIVLYFLFRPQTTAYFRPLGVKPPPIPQPNENQTE